MFQPIPSTSASRRPAARTAVTLAALVAVVAGAAPALAAQVVQVRVGKHPTFTRVVFELDHPAGYRVQRQGGAAGDELLVTLNAGSKARSIVSKSLGVDKVEVRAGGAESVARISLREPGLRLKEMILANPPRIVLDVMYDEAMLARLAPKPKVAKKKPEPKVAKTPAPEPKVAKTPPAPKPAPEAKAASKPEPAPKTAKKPEPAPKIAKKPEPAPRPKAATPEPAPEPKVAKTTVAPKPEEAPSSLFARKPEPAPEPKPAMKPEPVPDGKVAEKKAEPAPEPKIAEAPEPKPTPTAAETKAPAGAESPGPQLQIAMAPDGTPVLSLADPGAPEAAKPEMAKATPTPAGETPAPDAATGAGKASADATAAIAKPAPDAAGSEATAPAERPKPASPGADRPAPTAGATAKSAPKTEPKSAAKKTGLLSQLPVPAWAASPVVLGAAAGVLVCAIGFVMLMRRRRSLPNDLDVTAIAEEGADASAGEGTDSLLGGASSSPEASFSDLFDETPEKTPKPAAASGSSDDDMFDNLFGDAEAKPAAKGDAPMSRTSDLPADPARTTMASPRSASTAAPDTDVLRVVHELERRMGQLESKLAESNEARERLERQVAAQSEELRVQRAAIARTQRALRTMSRGDEDKATEPALRDGDTQARTRANPA